MATYIVYKNGKYIGEGTFEELAEMTGRTVWTLRTEHSRPRSIWEIVRVDYSLEKGTVDNDRILDLLQEFDYSRKELAEIVGISYTGLNQKLIETNPWRVTELEKVEDLFFLEEGDLIKEFEE